MPAPDPVDAFVQRWSGVSGSERANYQLFIGELCRLLDVPAPEPAGDDTRDNAYVFERRVTFAHGDGSASAGFIDCYRRGTFVLEAKKVKAAAATKGFDDALMRAPEELPVPATAAPPVAKRPWPAGLAEQIKAVAEVMAGAGRPLAMAELEARFAGRGRWRERLPVIVETLVALGRMRAVNADATAWEAA